jgi:predicted nucleic acid-binding protein
VALARPTFFDTSVLLGGLIEIPGTAASQRLLDAVVARKLGRVLTAWHCCLEVYSVSTRLPEEYRLAPGDAARLVVEEICGRFEVLDLPAAARVDLLRTSAADRVAGGRIYDAHIAEVAHRGGAKRVITENRRDFLTLLRHGIVVETAEEAAAALGGTTGPRD